MDEKDTIEEEQDTVVCTAHRLPLQIIHVKRDHLTTLLERNLRPSLLLVPALPQRRIIMVA